jgi:hypothetical protein
MMDVTPPLRLGSHPLQGPKRTKRAGVWLHLGLAAMAVMAPLVAPSRADAQIASDYIPTGIPGVVDLPSIPNRFRPEYSTSGVRLGDFNVSPSIAESVGYDSNYLATRAPTGGPSIDTSGTVGLYSDWSRNSLAALANVTNYIYPNTPSQDTTSVLAGIGGGYQIGRDTLTLAGLYVLNQITSTNGVGGFTHSPFDIGYVRAAYKMQFNRLSIEPELTYSQLRFGNPSNQGLTTLESSHDRDIALAGAIARYALSDATNAVGVVHAYNTKYTSLQSGETDPSSNSYQALVGLERTLEGIFEFRVLAGVETRTFSNSSYKTFTTPIFSGSVTYSPTQLTSYTVTLQRSIEDSVILTQTGYTYNSASFRVDHEYARNILLQGFSNVQLANNLQSSESLTSLLSTGSSVAQTSVGSLFTPTTTVTASTSSQDVVFGVGGGVTWLVNRNIRLGASYLLEADTTNHYIRNIALVNFSFGL